MTEVDTTREALRMMTLSSLTHDLNCLGRKLRMHAMLIGDDQTDVISLAAAELLIDCAFRLVIDDVEGDPMEHLQRIIDERMTSSEVKIVPDEPPQ